MQYTITSRGLTRKYTKKEQKENDEQDLFLSHIVNVREGVIGMTASDLKTLCPDYIDIFNVCVRMGTAVVLSDDDVMEVTDDPN